jgi:hypothetical protein
LLCLQRCVSWPYFHYFESRGGSFKCIGEIPWYVAGSCRSRLISFGSKPGT